jgi:hypothetical protein
MPVRTHLWTVEDKPRLLGESSLATELQLENMIIQEPGMISEEWMLIGRQEHTRSGGIIDLLALAPDGSLVLIELKRSRTPRDVVAQSLDYASWVENLKADEIAEIYGRFSPGRDLAADFFEKFSQALDEDDLNQAHQIIVVAAELDASTERIVAYLNDKGVPINVLCFQVFSHGESQILSRTWLLDPIETQAAASKSKKDAEPWNGEFYCSYGLGGSRSWPEAVEYGFICAGGGAWYSRTLQLLSPGDRVWVKVPGEGFVGVGRVLGPRQPASEFEIQTPDGRAPALDVLKDGNYHREYVEDEERCEYFVPMQWLETKPLDQAVQKLGMFGNQNTVCRPQAQTWRSTVDSLKTYFPSFDADGT